MSNREFVLKSGAKMHITVSSMEDCENLMASLSKCAKGLPIKDEIFKSDISAMKDYLIEAISSPEVKQSLWKCLERSSYDNVKITRDLFDDQKVGDKARGDYFEIMWKCIEVNCGPFFVRIFSLLKERLGRAPASPSPA